MFSSAFLREFISFSNLAKKTKSAFFDTFSKQEILPIWQVAPIGSTKIKSVSLSQSRLKSTIFKNFDFLHPSFKGDF